ncbi:hypothetical protein BC937DRAFT_89616 [Endogone sp. FLAS-F59071]|nr:hypothetical protein BC937DRAFT_89616 [Endogone sp. FLAS-F59071]|eukprot:RUS22343.1 hypothetical protein BC937DRAFT_89616 [Endogone sp. FLAS-F59071]
MPRRSSLCSQMRNTKIMNPFLQLDHKPRRLSLPCVPELKIVRHTVASLGFFLKPRCSYQTVQNAEATKCANMSCYWYSTDGSRRTRIDNVHLSKLDRAYETQSKIELNLGDRTLVASPSTGVLSSGDIHYGLYREPSLHSAERESFELTFRFPCETTTESRCRIL